MHNNVYYFFIILILFTGCSKDKEGTDKMNRLANSQSPYLLQHKNNPVDWYPWSEEAFEKAEKVVNAPKKPTSKNGVRIFSMSLLLKL